MNETKDTANGPADVLRAEKRALRAQFRAYRESLGTEEYGRLSRRTVEQAMRLPEVHDAATVHVYWPVVERREIDTRPVIRRLQAIGRTIVLPVVGTTCTSAGTAPNLTHVRFSDEATLRPNRWMIPEPAFGEEVPVEALDVVVVPALGAARDGCRIGYGYGYYDHFLRQVAAPKICLVYEACLLNAVPCEPHDVRVNVLVTEQNIVRAHP